MGLFDKFREIDLIWDHANDTITKNITALSSDYNGRKLVVQVISNGQIVDITGWGVSLALYWESEKDKTKFGLDTFQELDATKGIFEIYFTTGMLSNVGNLKSNIHLIDQDGGTTSKPFTIEVLKGLNTGAIQSTNSFTLLDDALNRVKALEEGGSISYVSIPEDSVDTINLVDDSVDGSKMVDVQEHSQSRNLFNPTSVLTGGYFEISQNGAWVNDANYSSSDFIPVEPRRVYKKSNMNSYLLWDANGDFIEGGAGVEEFATSSNTAFVTFAVLNTEINTTKMMLRDYWVAEYVAYIPMYELGDSWSIKKGSITGTSIDDVTYTSKTANLFNKDDRLENGYFNYQTGQWVFDNPYDTSNFIPVKPLHVYQKSNNFSYCLWDKNKNYLKGFVEGVLLTTPETAFITIAVAKTDLATTKLMEIQNWVSEYVPFEPKTILGDSWGLLDHAIKREPKEHKDLYLRVPAFYHDGTNDRWNNYQTTHPSVVQFDAGWNGWKYWMVHTPYPHGKDMFENPCIAVSDNGIKWENPAGISNPLVLAPVEGGYNSDGTLCYNSASGKLEMWYREVKGYVPNQTEYLKRMTSSDGVTWNAPELMIGGAAGQLMNYISPSIVYSNNQYKMWVMKDSLVVYMTSSDGKTWSTPVNVLANGQTISTWHPSVTLRNGTYYMLNNVDKKYIYYATAAVGSETSFSSQVLIKETTGNPWDFDGHEIYKATPLFTPSNVIMIYGTISYKNDWLLHATSGRSFTTMQPITQRAFDFYGVD